MSSEKKLRATLLAAIAITTIGAVDPFGKGHHLPSPRQYLAIVVLWGSLGLVENVGGRVSGAAGNLSVLTLLAMAVLGPFGTTAIRFLEDTAAFFGSEVVVPDASYAGESGGGELA